MDEKLVDKQVEKPWLDASDVVPSFVDWAQLLKDGQVKFYQGEPQQPYRYDLPGFDPRRVAPIAGLDLCLVRFRGSDQWAMAPARKDLNPWWIAAAYVRLGYIPPLALVDEFNDNPNLVPDETRRVINIIKVCLLERQERINKIIKTLTDVQKSLAW